MFDVALMCVFIFLARITDVSIATLRMIAIVNGRKNLAWVLGCAESLIWIVAVSSVFSRLSNPAYIIAWALGFGTGGYVGVMIEQWFAFGLQAIRVFTRNPLVVEDLRKAGYGVTQFLGDGRDGAVLQLFIKARRKDAPRVVAMARALDEKCFYTIEDVRSASAPPLVAPVRGWRKMLVGR